MPESENPSMADDSNTAIAILREQIAGLQQRNERLEEELAESNEALVTIGAERDDLQSKIQTPDALQGRVKELEGTIRTGKHRSAFAELAKKAGVREDAASDLFSLLKGDPKAFGLDPAHFDADEPDAKGYESALSKARETRGYAFADPADAGGKGRDDKGRFTPNQTPPVPGSGRGGRNDGADGTFLTAAHFADPMFMLDPANAESISLAAKEGRTEFHS